MASAGVRGRPRCHPRSAHARFLLRTQHGAIALTGTQGSLEWFHPDHRPCALRKGEHVLFQWPGESVNLQDHDVVAVRIFYSVLADDQPDSVLVEVVFSHGGENK